MLSCFPLTALFSLVLVNILGRMRNASSSMLGVWVDLEVFAAAQQLGRLLSLAASQLSKCFEPVCFSVAA